MSCGPLPETIYFESLNFEKTSLNAQIADSTVMFLTGITSNQSAYPSTMINHILFS